MKIEKKPMMSLKCTQVGMFLAPLVLLLPLFFLVPTADAADSPLLHNSNRFPATTKHGGAWGLPGTKYGEFSCNTCHIKNSGNIKRVKKTLTAPNGVDQFPIEADATPPAGGVTFMDARDGSSDFGDDGRADQSQSANICEACHTYDPAQLVGVKFHGYDMSVGGNPGHYNRADCITCHLHSDGFKPMACDSCHGYPPTAAGAGGPTGLANNPYNTGSATAGAHAVHAVTLGYACTNCHDGYNMPQGSTAKPGFGDISIGFNNFGSGTGSYSGQANVSYNDVLGSGTQSCATVYCHGSTINPVVNPTWTGAVACGDCHKDTAADPPTLGSHAKHAGSGGGQLNLACSKCHTTPGAAGHVGGNVSWSLDTADPRLGASAIYRGAASGTTAERAPSVAYGQCSNLYCHSSGQSSTGGPQAGGDYTAPIWGGVAACGSCHATTTLASGSHAAHLTYPATSIGCDQCHTGAAGDASSYASVDHVDTTIDVAITYTQGASHAPANGYGSCSTTYCHGDATPTWGGPAQDCASCHSASSALADSHGVHYNSATVAAAINANNDSTAAKYVFQCGNCHNGTTHAGGAVSANQAAEVSLSGLGTYTPAGSQAGTDRGFDYTAGSCATNACHNDGTAAQGAANYNGATLQWSVTTLPTDCTGCHDNNAAAAQVMTSNAHSAHVNDGTMMTDKACNTCHNVTVDATDRAIADKRQHIDGTRDVDIAATYDSDATPSNNFAVNACSNVYCHSDGKTTLTYQSVNWNSTISTCTACHGGAGLTTTLSASHLVHIGTGATDANKQFGFTCDDCHAQTASSNSAIGTPANHVNQLRDVAVSIANGGAGTIGGDYAVGTCATTQCHGSTTPAWTTGTANDGNCLACHGMVDGSGRDTNGDTLATDAQVGAHAVHLNPSLSAPVSCDQCHLTTVTNQAAAGTYVGRVNVVGHIDSASPAELVWGGIADGNDDGQATPAPTSCATSYCHDSSKIKNAWGGGTLAPTWTDVNFIQGNVSDCDNCHGYPPASGHVANTDCSACHDVLNADDVTFTAAGKLTHVDGIVQASGGDSCTDCHTADIDGALNGAHARHTDTATFLAGKTISGGNYGGAGWYTTTYVSGKPNFGCGECHPAAEGTGHPINGLNLDIDPAGETPTVGSVKLKNAAQSTPTFLTRSSITCASVYCHSDAQAAPTFATTPNWYGGTVSGNCNDCHGNAPATGTHDIHAVGIHYDTLYATSGTGLMATSGTSGSGAAHGDSATSNTINCQTCHNNTVAVAYNAANSVCSSCHSDTNAPATGNERAVISTTGSTHVNGQPDVVFASLTNLKAKSQLRDDITTVTELNNNWTRTNGYKVAANSFDQAKAAVPGYAAGSCSNIACHNGINTPTWTTGFAGDCRACHTSLPQ